MSFTFDMEVLAHDIDINRNATPSSITKYLQETVDRNLHNSHPTFEELLENNLAFVVSRSALKVYRPLKEYEKISIQTWATAQKSASFPRNYKIIANNETVAECVMVWALIDTDKNRLVRGTEFSVEGYGTGDLIELPIDTKLRISKETPFTKCSTERVLYRDIDRNGHMNNTKYYDLLFGFIPNCQEYYLTSCLMNFVSEAKLGDAIDIYISPMEKENDEISYLFKTEVNGKTNIEAKFTVKHI